MTRLLLVKTSAFGDVVQTLYVVEDIRRAAPGYQIFWCVDSRFLEIASLHPGVQGVIELPAHQWRSRWFNPLAWISIFLWVKKLRRLRFDIALDLQGMYKSALVCWLSGARRKIGRTHFSSVEGYSNYFLNELYDLTREPGLAGRLRAFCGRALGYQYANFCLQSGVSAKKPVSAVIALVIGASSDRKRWPISLWQELLILMLNDRSFDNFHFVIPWGNAEERQVSDRVANELDRVVVADSIKKIGDLADFFQSCSLVLGVDTGPVHLATATGVPVVMIFGRTSVEHHSDPSLQNLLPVGDGKSWPSAAAVFAKSKLMLSQVPPC